MTEGYLGFQQNPSLPDIEEIERLWERYGMLDNIRDHSIMVCRVAMRVSQWLTDSGVELNLKAVETGALLHDIAKTPCFGTDKRHDLEGQVIMEKEGFPELGYLVRCHVVLEQDHPLDETMVVNYADKRVTHDQIVSVDQRYEYIVERYGQGEKWIEDRIKVGWQRLKDVEKLIFERIGNGASPQQIFRIAGEE